MVTDLALCDRFAVATGPLPAMGRGVMTPGRQRHLSPATAGVLWYLLVLCTCAHEQVLVRGLSEAWLGESVQQMRPIVVFLATTLIARLTSLGGY